MKGTTPSVLHNGDGNDSKCKMKKGEGGGGGGTHKRTLIRYERMKKSY